MAQRYKLRLGDGTVVSVDAEGLGTWAEDRRAMAQAVGTQRWRPLHEVLAEEEAATRLARALVPPRPRQEAPPPPPPPPPSPPPPPLELPEFDLGMESAADAPGPSLQVLADDPVSALAREAGPGADPEEMPVIPMKPLDDEPVFQSAWSGEQESGEQEEYEDAEDERRQDRLDGPLLTVLETSGGFLSRWLDRLAPFVSRLTSRARKVAEPSDLDDEEEEATDRPGLVARITGWLSGLRARVSRPVEPEPALPEWEPAPPEPPALVPVRPAPVAAPVAAPTPLSELPGLRFKETREARHVEDVYEDDGPGLMERLGRPAWAWTKRVVLTAALAVGGAYAIVERETWLPIAANLGQSVFTEIDRLVLSRERSAEERRALEAAAQRLPQLSPETIRLVFTRSPIGVMEAPEVFQIASEAGDRGTTALTPAEAEELRRLRRELLVALSRTERERVREYDRTRSRRPIFPFENPHVMDLVARGARALPPERLELLRALSHQAVAAGLAAPEPAVSAGATR